MPVPNCPPEIKQMMTIPVVWEAFQRFDGHAEPTYGPEITLLCWQEEHGAGGGVDVIRHADGTVVEPRWDLYLNPDDANVRSIKVYDRFTPPGVATDSAQKLQAVRVNTFFGPPFDNRNPWLVVVTL